MLPNNFSVLVVGEPSAGMFEFCCYLGASYLKAGERLVFVEASASPDMVRRQMVMFGVDPSEFEESGTLAIVDAYSPPEVQDAFASNIRVRDIQNLEEVIQRVEEGIVAVGGAPVKVLLHSITPFFMHRDTNAVGKFYRALSSMVKVSGTLTCAVHRRMLEDQQIATLETVADGLLEMMVDERFRRFVRIKHFRGVKVTPKWVPFDFEKEEEITGAALVWSSR